MSGTRTKLIYGALAAGAAGSFATVYWSIDAMGILLGLMVATTTVLFVTGHRAASTRLIFTLGYHAGYHAGPDAEPCFGESCPVLEIAEMRVAQMERVSAA